MATIDKQPLWFYPLGAFFYFAATMASYAAFTLFWPGTILDRAWELNRSAHAQLAPLGRIMALPFTVLSVTSLSTAAGWFKRRRWAWIIGVVMIGLNLLGDLVNMVLGEFWKGVSGVILAGLLLAYLMRSATRGYFIS